MLIVMKKELIMRILTKICVTMCLCLVLTSCSKISQRNFDKIKNNMTMEEVVGILGEPTSSESITITGISGSSLVWKDSKAEIDIQMLNNRVVVKAFSEVNEAEVKNKN